MAYTEGTKAMFHEKNQGRRLYREAIYQIENTPEVAVVEGVYKGLEEGRKGAPRGVEAVGSEVSSTPSTHRVTVTQVRDRPRKMEGKWCFILPTLVLKGNTILE